MFPYIVMFAHFFISTLIIFFVYKALTGHEKLKLTSTQEIISALALTLPAFLITLLRVPAIAWVVIGAVILFMFQKSYITVIIVMKREYISGLINVSMVFIEFLYTFFVQKHYIEHSFLVLFYYFRYRCKNIVNNFCIDIEFRGIYQAIAKHNKGSNKYIYKKSIYFLDRNSNSL